MSTSEGGFSVSAPRGGESLDENRLPASRAVRFINNFGLRAKKAGSFLQIMDKARFSEEDGKV
jgi:hypothetical protein